MLERGERVGQSFESIGLRNKEDGFSVYHLNVTGLLDGCGELRS